MSLTDDQAEAVRRLAPPGCTSYDEGAALCWFDTVHGGAPARFLHVEHHDGRDGLTAVVEGRQYTQRRTEALDAFVRRVGALTQAT